MQSFRHQSVGSLEGALPESRDVKTLGISCFWRMVLKTDFVDALWAFVDYRIM